MTKRLKIAIFTMGRFHLCELAKQFDRFGHDVAFYSIVPPWRTKKFGLPDHCNRWLLPQVLHWLAVNRLLGCTRFKHWIGEKQMEAFDRSMSWAMEPCDVFIGFSGICNRSGPTAKRKYGAKVWIERPSTHIESQRDILATIASCRQVPEYHVKRELIDYCHADFVNVPSRHCYETFLERGFPTARLRRNTFGVDLDRFPATPIPESKPTVIMTGNWCLRKGCDVLSEAMRHVDGARLIHVGPVDDCPLPKDDWFTHHDSVDEVQLKNFYAQSHVLALASREEGLAFVQPQALSCGLRLVCTDRTGGADLAEFLPDPSVIRVVPHGDVQAFASALKASLADCRTDVGLRDRLGNSGREALTWSAYARRYERQIFESR